MRFSYSITFLVWKLSCSFRRVTLARSRVHNEIYSWWQSSFQLSTAYFLLSRSVASTVEQKVYIDILRYILIMISSRIWALMAIIGKCWPRLVAFMVRFLWLQTKMVHNRSFLPIYFRKLLLFRFLGLITLLFQKTESAFAGGSWETFDG